MRRDLGRFGKYMTTYRNLRRYEKEGTRFLFNLYIPIMQNHTHIRHLQELLGADLPIDPLPEKSVPAAETPAEPVPTPETAEETDAPVPAAAHP